MTTNMASVASVAACDARISRPPYFKKAYGEKTKNEDSILEVGRKPQRFMPGLLTTSGRNENQIHKVHPGRQDLNRVVSNLCEWCQQFVSGDNIFLIKDSLFL